MELHKNQINTENSTYQETGKLFILYGPSGSGKSTLLVEILKKLSYQYALEQVITYTCRLPRGGESNGKDYHFITKEEFLEKKNAGFFIYTTNFCDKLYGCPGSILNDLAHKKNLIIILNKDGAKEVAASIKNPVLIYITASCEELEKRLLKRNSETDAQRIKRLEQAKKEMNEEILSKLYHHKIVNDNFEQAVSELLSLLMNTLTSR